MSYETGDKFVLEIAEVFKSEDKTLYRAKNFASLVFDENGLQRLRRIRETTEEAYDRGVEHHVVEPSTEQLAKARAEGAEEAWEFVLATDEWDEDIRCYDTYAEAKAEFEKWEAEHKWEPKVGDEVMQGQFIGVVSTDPNENGEVGVWWISGGGGWKDIADLTPTGKQIDLNQIFEVLK